jgi:hypothetical protein
MRSLRWPDIKRQNREGANIVLQRLSAGTVYRLEPNSGLYALTLPADIIEQSGIPQN